MAIRSLLYHSSTLTVDSLNGVPWQIASRIWQRLVDARLDSVQTWKTFASAYPFEPDTSLKRRYQVIDRPNMRLGDYVKPVSSPSMKWITFLTLSHIACSRIDLVHLSQLPNIGVLTIGPNVLAEEIGIDDGIIRSWARTAAASDAFSMLRVLSCRSQKDITHKVFDYLTQFPALAIFNVEDCNLGSRPHADALCCGWKYRTGKTLSDFPVRGGTTGPGWDFVMHASFQLGGSYSTEALTAEGVEAIDDLPTLHLALGGPPRGAAVDATGDGSLRSYYRPTSIVSKQDKLCEATFYKRPLSQGQSSSNIETCKRPTIRASKQQDMEGLLMGFGG